MTKSFLKFRPRIFFLSSVIILVWAGLLVRFFYVQVVRGGDLRDLAKRQGENKIILPAIRGTVFDRSLSPLAENMVHYSFAVRPQEVQNPETLIKAFAQATGRSQDYYRKKIDSAAPFVYLERNLRSDISHPLIDIKDDGLISHRHGYRSYPHHRVASQIVGFTDVDNNGLEGIEREFNKHLKGRDGWIVLQTDGRGRSQENRGYPRREPSDGGNVVLTIDLEYQAILHNEVLQHMRLTKAKGALAILTEPHSGRILAMASVPDFDPNAPFDSPKDSYKNRVISDQFEPGSTFKLVPATAALSKNTVPLDREFNCEDGSYNFRGTVIRDWSDFGLLTFPQIVEHSSNVGIIKIAETVGSRELYLCARRYGFGSLSGIRLSGETRGVLKAVEEWSAISLAEISLGHEVSVSVLQLAYAYGAVANGGFLMKPIIVDRIVHPDGQTIYESTPQVVRKTASKLVMDELMAMFQRVVESGTGTSARIEGWNVAGKTGTAQKYIDGAYSKTKFISSFVGFFPADNPRILCVVVLDEPELGYHWGGVGAARVFREIMVRIVNADDAILVHKPPEQRIHPDIFQANQTPRPIRLMANAVVDNRELADGRVQVPNVRGKSLRDAVVVLRKARLKPKIQGSGRVIWQSPAPGRVVKANSICSIGLK